MPAIVEFPSVVQDLLVQYADLFANQPERQHFAEYLTGLFIAERKTVSGINREFAVTTDQSCLNRWITEVEWEEKALNQRRLELLQRDSATHYTKNGVIAIDNTLIDHDGKLIEDVGWFWDHAEKRHLIAHDYLIANYVCASGKHYPLEFRRFRKKDTCAATGSLFKNHTVLCQELVDWVVEQNIPGDFTFDSYFTHADILNHIDGYGRNYVGDLKFNRTINVDGRDWKASEWVKVRTGTAVSAQNDRRRQRAMVLHQKYSHSGRHAHGADCGAVERATGCRTTQDLDYQSHLLGSASHPQDVSQTLDRNGDLPSGREAASRHGRLSAQEGREPDTAYVSRIPGVQRLDDPVAARPCAGMGSGTPNDHRRVLSRHVSRDLGQNDRLGG